MKSGGLHGWQDLWIKHLKFCAGDTQVQITSLTDFPFKLAHVYIIKVSFLLENRDRTGSKGGEEGQLSLSWNQPACQLHLWDSRSGWVVSSHGHWLCLPPVVELPRKEYPPGLRRAPGGRPLHCLWQGCSPHSWPQQTLRLRLINEINCIFKLWLSWRGGECRRTGGDGEAGASQCAVICGLARETQELCQRVFVYHARGNCQSW